jgi:hypothetical protein
MSILDDRAHVPFQPFPAPTGPLQKEVTRLHADVARLAEAHGARQGDVHANVAEVHHLRDELSAEIERGAKAGAPDADREAELALALEKAKATCTEEHHAPRIDAALRAYGDALRAFENHVREHLPELIEELRPEADRVAAEYQRANEQARALLEPIEAAHHAMQTRIGAVTQYQRKFRRSLIPDGQISTHSSHWATDELLSVPSGYGSPPIPTTDQLAAYTARLAPPAAPTLPQEDTE